MFSLHISKCFFIISIIERNQNKNKTCLIYLKINKITQLCSAVNCFSENQWLTFFCFLGFINIFFLFCNFHIVYKINSGYTYVLLLMGLLNLGIIIILSVVQ